jgi:hypothetical protein
VWPLAPIGTAVAFAGRQIIRRPAGLWSTRHSLLTDRTSHDSLRRAMRDLCSGRPKRVGNPVARMILLHSEHDIGRVWVAGTA